jgi:hypothetical protein
MMATELHIKHDDIQTIEVVDGDTPSDLREGQLLLKMVRFAFTANNISYAHSGEALRYWDFFPTGRAGWGKLPVWGFADVAASAHPDIAVGERLYGFLPMATHLVVDAVKVSEDGLSDGASHRAELNPIYNRYVRTQNVAGYEPDSEPINALLRPMFLTSFLLDDFLRDNDVFGATHIIASSASSKTAYGMAFFLHQNLSRDDYAIVGLTSARNVDFVTSLGIYDQVLTYDQVAQLPADVPAVYVDFAGNGALRRQLHEHFGDNMKHNAIVGGTHWDKLGTAKGLPGAKPVFFFAPTQYQKRVAEVGRDAFRHMLDDGWQTFTASAQDWIDVQAGQGVSAIRDVYKTMLSGDFRPTDGFILQF